MAINNLITPYDLGNNLVEHTQRVNINDLVKQAQKELKTRLVQAQIKALGLIVNLTTSKTRFNGDRLWFICPICCKRVGTLYQHTTKELIGCRSCLNLKYKKQRFKGMIEAELSPRMEKYPSH